MWPTHGAPWAPMGRYEVTMGAHGRPWAPHGRPMGPKGPHGAPRGPKGPKGPPWVGHIGPPRGIFPIPPWVGGMSEATKSARPRSLP